MLDDEVVFLGSSSGKQSSSTNYPQVPHRPVTGIVLHVEKQNAPGTGCRMLFSKTATSVVHIGRRSGLEADTTHIRSRDHEQDSAMFRCAVVSRKHARIAFSDSGHAYLIDLASHHGTFVRKPGEKFSKMIKPETSTLLADGDIVTFGKSVGKGEETVMPIVARIELLFAGSNPSGDISLTPFKPLVVPSPSTPPFTTDRPNLKTSPSGRYGVHTSSSSSSSSSDESYSSHSPVVYSDIEEIPNPMANVSASASQNKIAMDKTSVEDNTRDNVKEANTNNANQGSFGQALNVLRRLLPPSQPPLSQVSSFFFGPESKPPSERSMCATPPFDIVHPHNVSQNSEHPPENPSTDSVASDPNPDESRASSPMDLGSPSSVSEDELENIPTPPIAVVSKPSNYTGLFMGRASPLSPSSPPPTLPPIALASDDVHFPTPAAPERMSIPLVNSPEGIGSSSRRSSVEYRYMSPLSTGVGSQYLSYSPDKAVHPPREFVFSPHPFPGPAFNRVKDVEGSIENLKGEIAKLHAHRRKYKARFNSNVQVISEKLAQFDDRLLEVNAEYVVLSNQVERIQDIDLAEINSHLEVLQDNVDEGADEREDAAMELEEHSKERDEIKVTLADLGQAVAELKSFRDDMKSQFDEQLAHMKSLHETTLAHITTQETQHRQTQALLQQCQEVQAQIQAQAQANEARVVASQVRTDCQAAAERCFTMPLVHSHCTLPQTPVLTSLKRKRDDTDENEEVGNEKHDGESKECDIEMNSEAVATPNGTTTTMTVTTSTTGGSSGYVIDGDAAPGAEGESSSDVVVLVVDDLREPTTTMDMGAAHDAKVHISDAPPPRKRARRFARVVAQTATAVTVGAVVTWSALAYS